MYHPEDGYTQTDFAAWEKVFSEQKKFNLLDIEPEKCLNIIVDENKELKNDSSLRNIRDEIALHTNLVKAQNTEKKSRKLDKIMLEVIWLFRHYLLNQKGKYLSSEEIKDLYEKAHSTKWNTEENECEASAAYCTRLAKRLFEVDKKYEKINDKKVRKYSFLEPKTLLTVLKTHISGTLLNLEITIDNTKNRTVPKSDKSKSV